MKIEIVTIADRAVRGKERLHLRVTEKTTLAYFVVLASRRIKADSIVAGGLDAYWFPYNDVKAGDSVILYTGSGSNSERKNEDGTTDYFFYWGLANTIWDEPEGCAVLLEVSSWVTSRYEEPTPAPKLESAAQR